MGYEFIDAAEVIFFDDNGNFEADTTDKELSERLEHVERAVIPGFYGSRHDGTVKTFSRGGSDVTGSIVAKAIHADLYENWTDVSGFLVADPELSKTLRLLRLLLIKSFVNWPTWVQVFFTKMLFSRYVRKVSRSISATPTVRMIREP